MTQWSELEAAIDRRIGHRALLRLALNEEIPGGASWAYVFGSAATVLFLVQLVTGIVLATFYSASATDAWASIAYLEREVTLGGLLRGVHHHAASAMVIIVGLHFLQVVAFGAYKTPREANWLSGLGLGGLVLVFALTGYLLPWDQTGYWATKVATNIAGTVPLIGGFIQRLAQGGNDYGSLTLTRFFTLHAIVLPMLTGGLIAAHLALFRKHGVTPKPGVSAEVLEKKSELFWPRQLAYDTFFAFAVVAVVSLLAWSKGAPLEAPADPASNFVARPEWYFLFLFQLLKYFEGALELLGTVIIPGLVTTFLVVLPFLDRGPERRPAQRARFLAPIGLLALGMLVLTGLALREDRRDEHLKAQKELAEKYAARALELAKDGVPVAGAAHMLRFDPLTRGERLFKKRCIACHPFEGHQPEKVKAPDLTGYRSRAWIRQVLRDADSHRLYGKTKVEGMPSFAKRSDAEIEKLVALVYSLRDGLKGDLEDHPDYPLVEELECDLCHEFASPDSLDGPSLDKYGSEGWVREVVSHPGADHLFGEDNTMPRFEERLSQEDIAAVVTFVMSFESREPLRRWPWVDDEGPVPTPRPKRKKAKKSAGGPSDAGPPDVGAP